MNYKNEEISVDPDLNEYNIPDALSVEIDSKLAKYEQSEHDVQENTQFIFSSDIDTVLSGLGFFEKYLSKEDYVFTEEFLDQIMVLANSDNKEVEHMTLVVISKLLAFKSPMAAMLMEKNVFGLAMKHFPSIPSIDIFINLSLNGADLRAFLFENNIDGKILTLLDKNNNDKDLIQDVVHLCDSLVYTECKEEFEVVQINETKLETIFARLIRELDDSIPDIAIQIARSFYDFINASETFANTVYINNFLKLFKNSKITEEMYVTYTLKMFCSMLDYEIEGLLDQLFEINIIEWVNDMLMNQYSSVRQKSVQLMKNLVNYEESVADSLINEGIHSQLHDLVQKEAYVFKECAFYLFVDLVSSATVSNIIQLQSEGIVKYIIKNITMIDSDDDQVNLSYSRAIFRIIDVTDINSDLTKSDIECMVNDQNFMDWIGNLRYSNNPDVNSDATYFFKVIIAATYGNDVENIEDLY